MCLLFVRCVCSCQQRVCGLVELALCHLNAVWDVFRNMIWFGFIAGTMRQKQKTHPSCDPSNMIKPTAPGLSPSDSCALPAGRAAEHLSGEADCWPVSLSPASKGPLIRWRDDYRYQYILSGQGSNCVTVALLQDVVHKLTHLMFNDQSCTVRLAAAFLVIPPDGVISGWRQQSCWWPPVARSAQRRCW